MIPSRQQRMSRKQCAYRSRSATAGTIDPEQPVDHTSISVKPRNDHMKIQKYSNASGKQKYPPCQIKVIFKASAVLSTYFQYRYLPALQKIQRQEW